MSDTIGNGAKRTPALANNQQLIWFGQQAAPTIPLYEVSYRYDFDGQIEVPAFLAAFRQFVTDTEVLRTVATDKNWTATRTREPAALACKFVDLRQKTNAEQELNAIVDSVLGHPFGCTDSLYEAVFIAVSEKRFTLILKVHHALTDAMNGAVMLKVLAGFYSAEVGNSPRLETHTYRDLLRHEQSVSATEAANAQRNWWNLRCVEEEGESPIVRSKLDSDYRQDRVEVVLDANESAMIRSAVSRAPFRQLTAAMSTFVLTGTVLSIWLASRQQTSRICFGVTSHGRSKPSFRKTVGLFMQVMPFQVEIDDTDSLESLAKKVAAESVGFLRNSIAGVMTAEAQRSFRVALNVIDLSVEDFAGVPVSMQWLHNGFGDPSRDLTVSVHDDPSGCQKLLFDFRCDSFTDLQRKSVISQFRHLLSEVVADSSRPIREIEFVSTPEKALLDQHSDEPRGSIPGNLWDRFLETAKQHSGRKAVCDCHSGKESSWTYRELADLAKTLAAKIEAVGCGKVVPVVCQRDRNLSLIHI